MWSYGPYGGMMAYGDGTGMGWMMLLGGVFWLLLIVLAVAAVVWVARSSVNSPRDPSARDRGSSGLDIIEERYARGEIDRDEYLQKRRDLLGRGAA